MSVSERVLVLFFFFQMSAVAAPLLLRQGSVSPALLWQSACREAIPDDGELWGLVMSVP